jgi:site-specific DNA recombinase
LERQQGRLLEVYLAEIIGRDEFERKHQEVTRTQQGLTHQLRQLEAQAHQQVNVAALAHGIDTFCRRLGPTLDTLTFAQRRQLVELLIDRVIVTDGQVEIRYVVPTGPQGETTPFCHLRLDYLHGPTAPIQGENRGAGKAAGGNEVSQQHRDGAIRGDQADGAEAQRRTGAALRRRQMALEGL